MLGLALMPSKPGRPSKWGDHPIRPKARRDQQQLVTAVLTAFAHEDWDEAIALIREWEKEH